ncbi:hypothetical protein PNK_0913 [Candidatus Protochlamydia naegleriophila]|uniref:MORN repeat-containing protein n=1 Tax=Candidatus Protochlamydia naegleriophila TaxID=389348 RepID=A0A0U5JCH9_9BACT|nr:hypothetical protein [Candidatus Protochlamydia naegleriophila]CUI16538.1 hypothetical protein PNK_0913 [Candidatus Protochlamydia naegleriophila]
MITFPNISPVSLERSHPSSVSLIQNITFFLGRIWTFISLTSHVSIQLIRRINGASQPIFKATQNALPSLQAERIHSPRKDHTPRIEPRSTPLKPPSSESDQEKPQITERERGTPRHSPKASPLSSPRSQSPISFEKEPSLLLPLGSTKVAEWPQSPKLSRDSVSSPVQSPIESPQPHHPNPSQATPSQVPLIPNLHLPLQSKSLSGHFPLSSPTVSGFEDDYGDESLHSSRSSQSATSSDFDDELEELAAIEDDLLETCLIEAYLYDYDTLEDALDAADIYDETQQPIELKDANGSCILVWKESITYVGDLEAGKLHGHGLFYQGLPRDPQKKVLLEGEFKENRFVSGWVNYQNERIYESSSFEDGELTTSRGTLRFDLKGSPVEYRGALQNGLPHGIGKILRHTKDGSEIIEEGLYEEGCLREGIREESNGKINHATVKTYYEGCFKDGLKDGKGIIKAVYHFCRDDKTFTFSTHAEADYEQNKEPQLGSPDLFWSDGAEGRLHLGDTPYADIKLTNGFSYTLYPKSLTDLSDVAFITGRGILRSPAGDQYEGGLKNAYMDGQGKITYADGRVEEGIFQENQLIS